MEEGICPFCGHDNLEYGTIELDGHQLFYPWECINCLAQGEEWYSLTFIEHCNTVKGRKHGKHK